MAGSGLRSLGVRASSVVIVGHSLAEDEPVVLVLALRMIPPMPKPEGVHAAVLV